MGCCISFAFPLRLPYRYSGIGGERVTIESAVHHDTSERCDERSGIVVTGDFQDDVQVANDDDDDDDDGGSVGGDDIVYLRRLAIRLEQRPGITRNSSGETNDESNG